MEQMGKEQSPYHGIVVSSILLIGVPSLIFVFVYHLLSNYQNFERDFNLYSALVIGYGLGLLFQLSCIVAGLGKGTFSIVVRRVVEFFSNLTISVKFALKCYFVDIKENGFVFWIYFIIVGLCSALIIIGVVCLYLYYGSYFM